MIEGRLVKKDNVKEDKTKNKQIGSEFFLVMVKTESLGIINTANIHNNIHQFQDFGVTRTNDLSVAKLNTKERSLEKRKKDCVLFCFVLFCFVLFCFVLFCFVLFCFVLFCFVLFCFVLFCCFCFVLFLLDINNKPFLFEEEESRP